MNARMSPSIPMVLAAGGPQALHQVVLAGHPARDVAAPVQPSADRRIGDDAVGGDDRAQTGPSGRGSCVTGGRRARPPGYRGSPVRSTKRAPWRAASDLPTIRAPRARGSDQDRFHDR